MAAARQAGQRDSSDSPSVRGMPQVRVEPAKDDRDLAGVVRTKIRFRDEGRTSEPWPP